MSMLKDTGLLWCAMGSAPLDRVILIYMIWI